MIFYLPSTFKNSSFTIYGYKNVEIRNKFKTQQNCGDKLVLKNSYQRSSFLALSFVLFVLFINALNAMIKSNITAQ